MARDRRNYCVYIMSSMSGTLYVGFSGNLHRRVFQHKFHHFEGFTEKYDVTALLGVLRRCAQGACARDSTQGMESHEEDWAYCEEESALGGPGGRVVPVDGVGRG